MLKREQDELKVREGNRVKGSQEQGKKAEGQEEMEEKVQAGREDETGEGEGRKGWRRAGLGKREMVEEATEYRGRNEKRMRWGPKTHSKDGGVGNCFFRCERMWSSGRR